MLPALLHLTIEPFVKVDGNRVVISLFSQRPLDHVWLRAEPDNEEYLVALLPASHCGGSLWIGELPLNPASHLNLYSFKCLHGTHITWLSAAGETPHPPSRHTQFRYLHAAGPAAWMKDQIWYQIFADRFANGDDRLSVKTGEFEYQGLPVQSIPWDQQPGQHRPGLEFYGGDLKGIEAKLDYLQQLGITALSLNPIFNSRSAHKYNPDSYDEVDPHFGGNPALSSLCAAVKQRGMRLILDAVVNHTGDNHPWFNRWHSHPTCGAYQSANSMFREFYCFNSDHPDSYLDWKGHRSLPVLNYHSDKLCALIFGNPDSALIRWLKPPYQIDGWRLDVAQMIGRGGSANGNAELVKAMGDAIRQQNPQACLIGEHWGDASAWLQSGAEDSVMNYFGFTLPVWAFLTGREVAGEQVSLNASELEQWLKVSRDQNSLRHQLSQLNLLNGTDTARFISLCHGDKAKVMLGIQLLFSYPGMPCLLYGDELGVEGDNEIIARRTFPWSKLTQENGRYRSDNLWFQTYQQMIAIRKKYAQLRAGAFLPLIAEDDHYVFARIDAAGMVLCAINRHPTQPVEHCINLTPLVKDASAISIYSGVPLPINDGLLNLTLAASRGELLFIDLSPFFSGWH